MKAKSLFLFLEQLVLSQLFYVQNSFESDYRNMIANCIQDNQPCFILFRLDSKSSLGFEWLFIAYSPDQAPVNDFLKCYRLGSRS